VNRGHVLIIEEIHTLIIVGGKSIKTFNTVIPFLVLCTLLSCVHLREKTYLDVYQGEPIYIEEMIESLTKARIVYIGEIHTLKRHHRFQLFVIKALYRENIPLTIGLEMLPFTSQRYLDIWIEGKAEKKEFLQLINWEESWGVDFDLYQPIFNFAREKKIKLLALNTPRYLVKKVAQKGLSSLTDEERNMLPSITPSSEEHREYLALSLSRHKTLKGKLEQYAYEAQDVWDSTMAHYVVEYLKSVEGRDNTMVVLAGSGHMAYGYGIPERVSKALDLPYRIVVSTGSGDLEFQKEWEKYIEKVELTHEDFHFIKRPIADYIFLVPLR
jgi:uncharacterized iron-regulated protein